MVRLVLIGIHVAAGVTGLVLGPVAMRAPKRPGRHTQSGLGYQAAVAVMAVTAFALVSLSPGRLWGFGVIAVVTEAAALAGWGAQRLPRPGWLPVHVSCMAGSYVSLVTAALVVNWPSPLAWILPTVVGTPLIAVTAARAAALSAATSVEGPRGRSR